MPYKLTDEGKRYLEHGLPEERFIIFLERPMSISSLKAMPDFSIALMWARKKGWVTVEENMVTPLKKPASYPEMEALREVADGRDISETDEKLLLGRKLITDAKDVYAEVKALEGSEVANLTADMIKSGVWRNIRLREYNVAAAGKAPFPGKLHPLSLIIEKIREAFLDMGFTETAGPLVESSFWNFDALYQPQDHPARDMADTFYMTTPSSCRLPSPMLVNAVKEAHENGGGTGSTGWRYNWDPNVAKKPVLRTHTTSVSARTMHGLKPPAKAFCIGRVFRNESIEYKSLPEFTQVEGIVLDEHVTFRDLLGYLREFYSRMGFEKVRFRPGYFPYTEMSVEPEVWFPAKKAWIELGGAGMFRPEVTKPLGVSCPVLAWGLGLERLAMLMLDLKDIRNFYYRNDLGMLRRAPIWL